MSSDGLNDAFIFSNEVKGAESAKLTSIIKLSLSGSATEGKVKLNYSFGNKVSESGNAYKKTGGPLFDF